MQVTSIFKAWSVHTHRSLQSVSTYFRTQAAIYQAQFTQAPVYQAQFTQAPVYQAQFT